MGETNDLDRPNEEPRTIGRALDDVEAALFVNRDSEVAAFTGWLDDDAARPLLNVVGRGGVGKSTLLGAFRRAAVTQGRHVLVVNAELLEPSAEGFMAAVAPGVADVIGHCNALRCVLLIDAYGGAPWMTRFLQEELLPHLDEAVRVVIAGRAPLGEAWTRWHSFIERMTLEPLSAADAREYVRRRGVDNAALTHQIVRATGGLPLALALAADLVTKLGARDLGTVSEWRLVVRGLAERLVHDVADVELVELIEACSLVRHFDEPALAAITGSSQVGEPFARLCGLSFVRAGEHGLMLHDDIRQVVADDLRWRNPTRFGELRQRALTYVADRMSQGSVEERHWLWAERMFLWEDAFVRSALFLPATGEITVSVARQEDIDDAIALERRWHDHILPKTSSVAWSDDYPQESVLVWLRRAMQTEGARLAVARDVRGNLTGYSLVVPVFQTSLRLLEAEDSLSALVHAWWSERELQAMPVRAEDADDFVIVRTCVAEIEPDATNAALLRDLFGLLSREGTYLVYAAFPERKALFERLGFEPLRASAIHHWIVDFPFQAYILDLKRIGFEAWLEAITDGRTPMPRPSVDDVEEELAELFPVWDDDASVGRSALGVFAGGADEAREMVQSALERLREGDDRDLDVALRAVQLAYLERAAPHERLAERLSVSRSTFYRLLKRGIRVVAEALGRPTAAK